MKNEGFISVDLRSSAALNVNEKLRTHNRLEAVMRVLKRRLL